MQDALRTYDRIAPLYDVMDGPYELLWKRRLRADVFRGLSGKILDAGAGTGCNIVAYPPAARVTAVDGSDAMLARARIRARSLEREMEFARMDLTALAFPDGHFDAVVATFVFMCIPPEHHLAALSELARVCAPDGEIRLLDYCLSRKPLVRFGMRAMTPWLKYVFAARYESTTESLFEQAGLVTVETRLVVGDIVKLVRLKRA